MWCSIVFRGCFIHVYHIYMYISKYDTEKKKCMDVKLMWINVKLMKITYPKTIIMEYMCHFFLIETRIKGFLRGVMNWY